MSTNLGLAIDLVHRTKIDRRGSKNGRAKLTEALVIQIRQEFDPTNTSMTELAQRYHVSVATISKALRGEYWSHI